MAMYYLIGGGTNLADVFARIVKQACNDGPGRRVIYIDAAAGDQHAYTERFEQELRSLTCDQTRLERLDLTKVDTPSALGVINSLQGGDVIYMEGGRLRDLKRAIISHGGMIASMQCAHRRGVSIGGMSAGGIILGAYAVNGDEKALDIGIGWIPNAALSAHLDKEETRLLRENLIIDAMRGKKVEKGYFVAGGSALIYENEDMQVITTASPASIHAGVLEYKYSAF